MPGATSKPAPGADFIGVGVIFWCHDGQGNVLLQKRSGNRRYNAGVWDCGGGTVEFGENVEDTLRREIMEEYSVEPSKIEYLGFREVHHSADDGTLQHWIAFDFKVLVEKDKVRLAEPDKVEALDWFRLEALPEPLHKELPGFIEKNRKRLV